MHISITSLSWMHDCNDVSWDLSRSIVGKVCGFQPAKTWRDFPEYELTYGCDFQSLSLNFKLLNEICYMFLFQFTEHGIEGVVPLELLPDDVRARYQAKPGERTKRAKKEETKISAQQAEENQVPESELNLMFPVSFFSSL